MSEIESRVYDSIDEANRNQWNNLVRQSGKGTVFHRYGWLRAVETGLGKEARHIMVSKGGNPVAVLPNFVDKIELGGINPALERAAERLPMERLVSTDPGYGGPIAGTDTSECLDILFETRQTA